MYRKLFLLFLLQIFLFMGCTGKERTVFEYSYFKEEIKSWDDVFSSPSQISLEILKTGEITVKKSGVINLKSPLMKGVKDEIQKYGMYVYLIFHKKRGYFLINTGLDSSFYKNPHGKFKGIFTQWHLDNRFSQKENEGIDVQLKNKGIKLQGVFLTHLGESLCGVLSLPSDILYVFGSEEKEPFIYREAIERLSDIRVLDFDKAKEISPLGKSIDIFGDGSLWAISTPGYTQGHVSYLLNSLDGPILITGNACITRFGFEYGVEPGKNSFNVLLARESLIRLIKFAKMYPKAQIVFGYEI